MKINYNVTGQERKDLVNSISGIMGIAPVYAGAGGNVIDGERHRFSYVIMNITITQNGEMIWDDRTDNETLNKVFDGLTECGYTFDRPVLETDGEEYPDIDQHHPGQYANPDAPMTEGMMRQIGESISEYQNADGDTLAIEMPLDGFTDEAFANLEKLITSKAGLIKKALGVEILTVEKAEHRLRFPWFNPGLEPEVFTACAWFISALCNAAKEQKRVTAKEKPVDNEKFAFRVFLIRLGFVGDEYKNARKILLRSLTGNSAFKNGRPEPTENNAESEGGSDE